jgi:HD-GYP domain-containing protein (c-di-GMP phosphodiesterase class II)
MNPSDVVVGISAARRAVQLYPPTHPAFAEAIDSFVSAAHEATATGPLVLNVHQGRLYHESLVLAEDVHGMSSVAEAFEAHRIESLTIDPGFSDKDAVGFVEVLALRPSPDLDTAEELSRRGVGHVTLSVLADDDREEREERDRRRQSDRALYTRIISGMRALSSRMASGGGLDLGDTQNMVGSVLERFLDDPSAVLALATIRGESDHQLFHSLNVMIFSVALGQRLGLPEEGLRSLALSALLHDVGKTAFDAGNPDQVEAMRAMHPGVGAEILQRLALEDPAPMLVAYEHHMYANGTGFPDREADYVPHPYSRMVTIANRYDNLTVGDERVDALTPDKAIVQVLREAGSLLDPFFARLFASALGVFPIGSMVRLSDQSVGVVCGHGDDPLAPSVRLAYDADGHELDSPQELDLSLGEVRIVEVIEADSLNVKVSDKL